jgi:hypothetical protein
MMALDCSQLKNEIIIPALDAIHLNSDEAVNLLLGTAAQESGFGTYVKQKCGVALGIFQMEPATYKDTYTWFDKTSFRYLGYSEWPSADRMVSDMSLAAIMCRLKYYRMADPLPKYTDVDGMASYWKKFYNTPLGGGQISQFIANYQRYVTC